MGKGEHEDYAVSHQLDDGFIHQQQFKEKYAEAARNSPGNKVVPQSPDTSATTLDHAQALEKQRLRREQKPLLYCKLVTKYPVRSFLITLGCHLLAVVISIGLVISGYDLLPVDFENLPLEINDQPWRPRDLAWEHKDSNFRHYDRTPTTGYRFNSYPRASIDLYYDGEGDNIFTKGKLKAIEVIEERLVAVPDYSNSYCQLNTAGTACEKPTSILRYFDGTYADINPVFNDTNYDNIAAVLYEANTNNDTKGKFQFFLGTSHQLTPTRAYSSITRSIIPMGYPLQGYSDYEDYEAHMRKWSAAQMKPILAEIREHSSEFDFAYRSDMLWLEDVLSQAMKDVMFAIGSIFFISIFILVHTRSLWITGFAILSILTSFVGTNLIYRVILDFRYIGFFHVLTLFIVLGIGADDIFVFYDVWRNTACESYPSLAHRLSDAYRKSVFSMLFTSITTAVAFFASAISPLLATRSFGVFSGLIIIVNYLSVILYFPTVVIMYHTKFETFKWPCIQFCKRRLKDKCKCCSHSDSGDTSNSTTNQVSHSAENAHSNDESLFQKSTRPKSMNKGELSGTCLASDINETDYVPSKQITNKGGDSLQSGPSVKNAMHHANKGYINKAFEADQSMDEMGSTEKQNISSSPTKDQNDKPKQKPPKKKSFVVVFFRDKYSWFVTHKIFRWIILCVMAIVLVVFSIQASRLEPDNEGFKVLKDSHVYSIAKEHAFSSFVVSNADRTLIIYIVWGMLENDLSDCHFSTPKCVGKPRFDKNFNPSTPVAQQAMLDLCETMLSLPNSRSEELRIRRDFTTGDLQVNCYMKNLDTFLQSESISTGNDWNLTYDYSKAMTFVSDTSQYYNTTDFNSTYDQYLEIPISYWLSNRYSFNYTDDFYLFDHLLGEELGDFTQDIDSAYSTEHKYGNNIKYVGIQVNTTIKAQKLGYAEGIPIMDAWEEFVNGEIKNMPTEMKSGFQITRWIWHWLIVSRMLAQNAIYGVALGVSLAFPILVIATGNIITGFLATFSMCCSTVCVIGIIPLGGWKLGVLVSLNMCMVVGLTVDYVVHLAEGYTLSLHHDRLSRVRDMLDEMAVSIFFGACTTLGASLFMFMAQLAFFLQFGVFMFSTIGFSLFFSMGMFVTLMGIVGPQGDTGNVLAMCRKAKAWCKRRKSRDSSSEVDKDNNASGHGVT